MAEAREYDVVSIGAGPAGYVAAIRAAQLGLRPAVVEKGRPGGVCLNIGCIPSKALIDQATLYGRIPELRAMGVQVDVSRLDYAAVWKRSRAAADRLSRGVEFLLRKNKIDLVAGTARIDGPGEVTVDGTRRIRARNILVASGSRPRELPDFPFDERTILSSDGLLMLESLPKSLLVLGAGAIGVELAYVMNAFGVEVHLVEMLPRILPLEDAETVAVLARQLQKQGVRISVATRAAGMTRKGDSVEVALEGATSGSITVEKVLVAVGRSPNTEGFGLVEAGVTLERGFVKTGDFYETSVKGIYAVGDVAGAPLLAHAASKEGEIAVERMAGRAPAPRLDPLSVPSAVYAEPQLASFGLTEDALRAAGRAYAKATFPYRGAGKAVAVDRVEGMIKTLTDSSTREILGVHIVGAEATELIHELLLARTAELLPEDVATMMHAHPTFAEVAMEGMRAAEGWAVHA